MICRHCNRERPNRGRGLCFHCYGDMAVRKQYRSAKKTGRWADGIRDFDGEAPLPPAPTSTIPGGLARLWVMRSRLSLGVKLQHPHDAHFEGVGVEEPEYLDPTDEMEIIAPREWLSGEAALADVERRIGRPLSYEARCVAMWPWEIAK